MIIRLAFGFCRFRFGGFDFLLYFRLRFRFRLWLTFGLGFCAGFLPGLRLTPRFGLSPGRGSADFGLSAITGFTSFCATSVLVAGLLSASGAVVFSPPTSAAVRVR
jgi:hypothetical protein